MLSLSFWIIVPVYVCSSHSSHSLLKSIMLNMQFPALPCLPRNVRVFHECTLLAVLIDSLESSSFFLQMQSVRLLSLPRYIHHILWYFWFPEPLGSKQGQVGCSTPCHPSIAGVSHPGKTSVRMFHGIVSQDWIAHLRKGQGPIENCGMLDPKRRGTEVWCEKKKQWTNSCCSKIFHDSYPLSPWNHKFAVCVCVCVFVCVWGLFRFGCIHICTICIISCILIYVTNFFGGRGTFWVRFSLFLLP